ncbi:MAG: hypothetical protein R8G34_06595 [Paracoccaceae bacterium]|nr:hypothetical protein [Paracoccaceae bacterium]
MNKTANAAVNGAARAFTVLNQVIEKNGGEYRNRTRVHGFARSRQLKVLFEFNDFSAFKIDVCKSVHKAMQRSSKSSTTFYQNFISCSILIDSLVSIAGICNSLGLLMLCGQSGNSCGFSERPILAEK